MTDATRESIILAAFTAAGPAGENKAAWRARVKELASDITIALDENSALSKTIDRLQRAEKPFPATIVGGRMEQSSTRCVVDFIAHRGDGKVEQIRTDRTDTPDGKRMMTLARELKGHSVLIYKLMEQNGDKKFRVLIHLVDLGVDKDAEQRIAAAPAAD